MENIYKRNPVHVALVSRLKPLRRGSMAAESLAKQRKYLGRARTDLRFKNPESARYYLAQWAKERHLWAHLVGRVSV